jgi:hypothetical protein
MSDGQPDSYKLDQTDIVNEQVRGIAAVARKSGNAKNSLHS